VISINLSVSATFMRGTAISAGPRFDTFAKRPKSKKIAAEIIEEPVDLPLQRGEWHEPRRNVRVFASDGDERPNHIYLQSPDVTAFGKPLPHI
jgi:hypothetical protein